MRNERGAIVCEACGARHVRRTNGLGWTLIMSVVLLPVYGALRLLAPDMVAPRRWRTH